MATAEQVRVERRFFLRGVPWQAYLGLRDVPENQHVRMTYDRGDLEIMSPSRRHERLGYLIGRLIDVWTEELNIEIQACRTMTCRREDLQRGFEPDNCYYVANEPQVWNKAELDLSIDPPPDLAIEIDVTGSALDKMDIYAAFGVPEVWRYDGRHLEVYELGADGRYQSCELSMSFPQLPMRRVEEVLRQAEGSRDTALVLLFRRWVREEVLPQM